MDLNLTLVGQMITFALFVWFTMKFVWPPLMKIMEERRQKIADGLAAAEQGRNELELAQHKSKDILEEAKTQAAHIIEQANQRSHNIVEDAKEHARTEGDRLLQIAQGEIQQEYVAAKEQLMTKVSEIAIAGAERILQSEINAGNSEKLVDDLVKEI